MNVATADGGLVAVSHGGDQPTRVGGSSQLLALAAEAIVKVLPSTGPLLVPYSSSAPGNRARAIAVFGPPILEKWCEAMSGHSTQERRQMLTHLAALSVSESRAQVLDAMHRYAPEAKPEERSLAVEYLSAIPVAVRRCPLVELPALGGTKSPSVWSQYALAGLLPTDAPPLPLGAEVPGTSYRLEDLLGVGGFGAVYKATNRYEQHQPPRAIKFCLDPTMVPTLHRERAILDRLMAVDAVGQSDHIVRLYGYALDSSPPFLVYEYVPGGDLTSRLAECMRQTGRGFTPAEALEVIRQTSQALAVAHGQGLVHRDLKPANLLVHGAKIRLTDFGIGGVVATHALSSLSMASSGFHMLTAAEQACLFRGSGTPLYMCAEQRRGDHPDPRHDLYSLGVVWFQLLVGDVTRELDPGWSDELREECGTPESHIELIQRCVGYFKKRPLDARELPALIESAQSSMRSETSATGPALACLRRNALADDSVANLDHLRMHLVDQIDRDKLLDARDTAGRLLRLLPKDPEACEALAFIETRLQTSLREEHHFAGHAGWVRAVATSPDGRFSLSGGDDATARLWDLTTRQERHCLRGHEGPVMAAAFAACGPWAVTGGWDGTARYWDMNTGQEVRRVTGPWQAIRALAVGPQHGCVVTGTEDSRIHIWEVATGRTVGSLVGHVDAVQAIALARDARYLASSGDDNTIRIWDLTAGRQVYCLEGHADAVTSVAWGPGARHLLSASSDGTVRLWDMDRGEEVGRLVGHSNWVNTVVFSPDGRWVVTGSGGTIQDGQFQHGSDTTIRLWELASARELCRFAGHQASVSAVAMLPCGARAVAASLDGSVRLLKLPQ